MLQEEARLKEEIEGLLERAGAVDGEEDERYGQEMRGANCLRSCNAGRSVWRRSAAKARLEAAQRAGDDARGRTPGQGRNPKGGRPYKRAYGEPEPKAQSNFTDPESRIMNTSRRGSSSATTRRRRSTRRTRSSSRRRWVRRPATRAG